MFDGLDSDDDKEYEPSETELDRIDRHRADIPTTSSNVENELSVEEAGLKEKSSSTLKKLRKPKKSVKGKTRAIKAERKRKRNHGEEYSTESGKIKKKRECQTLGLCRTKCIERFSEEDRQKIFDEYWGAGSHEKRVSFVTSLITKTKKSTTKNKVLGKDMKNREFTLQYSLRINGVKHKICKECFRKTLGETNKFLELCSLRLNSSCSGIYENDHRGQDPPKNKYSEEDIDKVRQFILKIPLYESHYSRRDTNKKYLPSHYTVTKIFDHYRSLPDSIVISRTKFDEIFHSLNIGIKRPSKDTCGKCDKLKMKINLCSEEEEKNNCKAELDAHLKQADDYYKLKAEDKAFSKNNPVEKTAVFDLQQCLPTPLLASGITFYLRQLWTFNLTVHNCDDNQAYCYMWHEAIAARGANQVASCLQKFLTNLSPEVETITFYSDSCPGQNKNGHIVTMYFTILKNHPSLKAIKHKFLIPGHTHMECDGDHALIEKNKKRTETQIHHPRDWFQLVRCTGKKHPFKVIEMTQLDFFDYASLLKKDLQVKKKNEDGENFYWRDVREIMVKKEESKIMFYKTEILGEYKKLSFRKRGKESALVPSRQYNAPVPISAKKKENLMEILPYISDVFWDFYKNLVSDKSVAETHPDIVSSDDED